MDATDNNFSFVLKKRKFTDNLRSIHKCHQTLRFIVIAGGPLR
jgi:hypothetical protein